MKKKHSPKHGVKIGKGEPRAGTDGYYEKGLCPGPPVKTTAAPWGGCKKPKVMPCGPIRDGRQKIKIP